MEHFKDIEIPTMSWCDVNLINITWKNDGRDLVLSWELHNNKIGALTCTWAQAIKINLVSKTNEGGAPLTFDAEFIKQENETWKINYDFSFRGNIELICNEIFLETKTNS